MNIQESINKKRRDLYMVKTDPLLNEAHVKRLLGLDYEADELEIKVLTLREEIQHSLPYPITLEEG